MKPLFGLQARFLAIVAVFLLLIAAALGVLLLRQSATQGEVLVQSGNEIHEMVSGSLRSRGESTVEQAADSLVNPVYYFDLEAIGRTARALLQQPNVRYVIVYDSDGNVIHDGSADIPTFGQKMRDPFAYEAMAADGVHVQQDDGVLEVSAFGEWTVLVSSHDIDEVERLADHVALLDAGRLRLSERTEELQARFRRVEVSGVTGRDGAAAPPAGSGNAIALERAGALLRFVETAYAGEASERRWREDFGAAATVRAQPMTLREIFMALAREGRGAAMNEPPAVAVQEASA